MLLGVLKGTRLHIQSARGHEYFVGVPAATVCRACKALNELATLQELGKENTHHRSKIKD
jgi:hypothetical protein